MSIRLRLIMVLVTMSTLAMVALSVVFMAGNLLLAKGRDDASHQRVVNTAQRSLERSLTDQAAAVRLYVLSANERALIPYRQGLDVERTASTALEIDPLLAENDPHRRRQRSASGRRLARPVRSGGPRRPERWTDRRGQVGDLAGVGQGPVRPCPGPA